MNRTKMERWQLKTFLAFTLVYPLYYLGRYNYTAVLPAIMLEFNWSYAMVGSFATVLTLTYAFGQLINGFFADRYGPRLMLALGGIMSMVMNFFTSMGSSFMGMMMTWGINGYFQAMGWNSVCKLEVNWFSPKRRGVALSFVDGVCGVVTALIPVLIAILMVDLGWRSAFWLPSIILAVACIIFYLVVQNKPGDVGLEAPWLKEVEKKSFVEQFKYSYRGAFADWRLVLSYCIYGCTQFCRFGLITWLPIWLFMTTGRSLLESVLVASLFQWGASGGSILFGWLSDKVGRIPIIALGLILGGVAIFGLVAFPTADLSLLILLFTVAGIGIEAIEIPLFLMPIDILGEDRAGTTAGVMNCIGKLGATAQGIGLGFIIDVFGFHSMFALTGLISFLGVALLYPLWRGRH